MGREKRVTYRRKQATTLNSPAWHDPHLGLVGEFRDLLQITLSSTDLLEVTPRACCWLTWGLMKPWRPSVYLHEHCQRASVVDTFLSPRDKMNNMRIALLHHGGR